MADRVLIGSFCDAQKLEDIVAGQSAFVVCDCEGYERVLFGALDTTAFETTTFLVEVHDFIDPTISEFIISKLNGTHFVERFFSASSVEKWRQFKGQPFFDEFDAPSQLKMVSEGRPEKMEWLLFQPLEKAALVRSGLYCST